MRRITISVLVVGLAVAVGGGGSVNAEVTETDQRGTLGRLAYTATAQASPYEELPGRGETALGPRFFSSRSISYQPPAAGYGLAAAVDVGTTEAFTGPIEPRVEVDSETPSLPDEDEVREGTSRFFARTTGLTTVTESEGSYASSDGFGSGSGWSAGGATAGADGLIADARSGATGVSIGPFSAASVTSFAYVQLSPGREPLASGGVDVSEAELAGIPVVVGVGGVDVDESRIPAEQLDAARDQITTMFSSSEYFELRVAGPVVEELEGGRRVRTGGLIIGFSSGDANGNYFFRTRVAGATAEGFLGADLGESAPFPTPTVPAPAEPQAPVTPEVAPAPSTRPPAAPDPTETADDAPTLAAAPAVDSLRLAAPTITRATVDLPRVWPGEPWALASLIGLVAVGLVTAAGVAPWSGRAAQVWNRLADGYLRG
ncbi:MAG TPA: hypothetical protein VGA13_08305 [Acidimicrobiales bacterium]